jgi:hypothetical protein
VTTSPVITMIQALGVMATALAPASARNMNPEPQASHRPTRYALDKRIGEIQPDITDRNEEEI